MKEVQRWNFVEASHSGDRRSALTSKQPPMDILDARTNNNTYPGASEENATELAPWD